MTAQASLLEYACEEQAVEEVVVHKDRFDAESHDEFIALTLEASGKKPTAQDWLRWWPLHPEEFEKRQGVSWRTAQARSRMPTNGKKRRRNGR